MMGLINPRRHGRGRHLSGPSRIGLDVWTYDEWYYDEDTDESLWSLWTMRWSLPVHPRHGPHYGVIQDLRRAMRVPCFCQVLGGEEPLPRFLGSPHRSQCHRSMPSVTAWYKERPVQKEKTKIQILKGLLA